MALPALWIIVTEAIYDVRESDIFPKHRLYMLTYRRMLSRNGWRPGGVPLVVAVVAVGVGAGGAVVGGVAVGVGVAVATVVVVGRVPVMMMVKITGWGCRMWHRKWNTVLI